MAKEFAKKFYQSKAWKSCRESYIAKRIMVDGGLCEICHQQVGYILHHKKHLTPANINDPDVTLNHCNLEYVCKDCHDNIHFRELHQMEYGVMFDDKGQLIPERK